MNPLWWSLKIHIYSQTLIHSQNRPLSPTLTSSFTHTRAHTLSHLHLRTHTLVHVHPPAHTFELADDLILMLCFADATKGQSHKQTLQSSFSLCLWYPVQCISYSVTSAIMFAFGQLPCAEPGPQHRHEWVWILGVKRLQALVTESRSQLKCGDAPVEFISSWWPDLPSATEPTTTARRLLETAEDNCPSGSLFPSAEEVLRAETALPRPCIF